MVCRVKQKGVVGAHQFISTPDPSPFRHASFLEPFYLQHPPRTLSSRGQPLLLFLSFHTIIHPLLSSLFSFAIPYIYQLLTPELYNVRILPIIKKDRYEFSFVVNAIISIFESLLIS